MESAEWHLLETLAPHLQRAAAIRDLLSRARATADSLGAAVAAAGFAVFLLTGDCRVLFANAKAEDLVRHGMGLRYEHERLAATSPALTARLQALARHGACQKTGEAHAGGTLEVWCGENRPPLLAHIFPLAPIRPWPSSTSTVQPPPSSSSTPPPALAPKSSALPQDSV